MSDNMGYVIDDGEGAEDQPHPLPTSTPTGSPDDVAAQTLAALDAAMIGYGSTTTAATAPSPIPPEEEEEEEENDDERCDMSPPSLAAAISAAMRKPQGLVAYLCELRKCTPSQLELTLLHDEKARRQIQRHIREHLTLHTNHLGSEHNVTVRCDEISEDPVSRCMAYNGFMDVTVPQYFYIRHRVRLHYGFMPCIMEVCGKHRAYYPLEVLSCTGRLGQ